MLKNINSILDPADIKKNNGINESIDTMVKVTINR